MPNGVALYVRRITQKRHGSPKQFATKCAKHCMGWMAIGGPWQEPHEGKTRTRMINQPKIIKQYADALEAEGIDAWVWGYPWQGEEERFVEKIAECGVRKVLLDPELGANPTRSKHGAGKQLADAHARSLVRMLAQSGHVDRCGLSTYGRALKIGWFPLLAYTEALAEAFPGKTFIGGQTYTDDRVIDTSIREMTQAIEIAGGTWDVFRPEPNKPVIQVVPNFGMYSWDTPSGRRTKGARARKKKPMELRGHLYEFVDDPFPIDAVIGWAENFASEDTWQVLEYFAINMQRGACVLPEL